MTSYLVTGASRGIGLELVTQLSVNPENMVFSLVRNKATASKLSDLAARALIVHILQADVVDVEALKAAAADISKVAGGSLHYLINNAALVDQGRSGYTLTSYGADGQEALLEKDIHDMIHINVIGVITISSGVADSDFTVATGFSTGGPYAISKAAVNLAVGNPGLVNTAQSSIVNIPTLNFLASPEELKGFAKLIPDLKKAYPDWDGNPITPETSVKHVLSAIDKVTPKDTGTFVSHFGDKKWL